MSMIKKLSILTFILLGFMACEDDNGTDVPTDSFDRQAMLVNWADNIIVPGYIALAEDVESLRVAVEAFLNDQSEGNFQAVRESWLKAYLSWQDVSMFEIGKAEELMLRDYLNIYPVDTEGILENLGTGSYNLELPSQRDRQGFAAMDFLLYGVGASDEEILDTYTGEEGIAYLDYLSALSVRIEEMVDATLASWVSGYRDEFVSNDGSSANASVDRLVNDFMFYYEKALRAGKVGIPAGVFSADPLPAHVEGLFSKTGKQLLQRATNASLNFFTGQHLDGAADGPGLEDYLQALEASRDGMPLDEQIIKQFGVAIASQANLSEDLQQQVATDNTLMLQSYDELQKNVVLMKVDMLQSLNINVDYVDADGD
jgi:hypothetical protein